MNQPLRVVRDDEDSLNVVSEHERAALVLPVEQAMQVPCIGLRFVGDVLHVAAPEDKWDDARALAQSQGIKIELHNAPSKEVQDALAIAGSASLKAAGGSLAQFATVTGDAPVAKLVEELIEIAIRSRASDLHIEPFAHCQRVRLRVDGRLRLVAELPMNLSASIASRVKVLSKLNIVERRRPQDGQFSIKVDGRSIDVRVAVSATMHGEKIVMRLLDESRPFLELSQLGMSPTQLEQLSRIVGGREGLVLAAGPTGSGKTTTLHTALRAAYAPHKNVTTIEDPVEYVVDEINQIPIIDHANAGFAVQLRSILRQDPDVILVGETRDEETARIAIQAALTGHLVLSSIHGIDAVGAVYRLIQMDIEPYLIASSLKLVAAQRLVRRVCAYCREETKPSSLDLAALAAFGYEPETVMVGAGCSLCSGTGYRDRVAAYQVLEVTEDLAEVLASHPEPGAFRAAAIASGMTTMAAEAMRLAVAGFTTVHEAMALLDNHD